MFGCKRIDCPDCAFADFVERIARMSAPDVEATFTHWPGEGEIVDEIKIEHGRAEVTRVKGHF